MSAAVSRPGADWSRLVTWNVNSLNARLPRVLEFLEEHRPDVVCLQETKTTPEAFPHDALRDAGYSAVDTSGGRWAGVAILAREGIELEDPAHGLPGQPAAVPAEPPPAALALDVEADVTEEPQEARWVEATAGGVRVVSVYVPNGRAIGTPSFEQKLRFLDAAAERLSELAAHTPVAVVGDMNIARTDQDLYDPAAFVGSTHVTPEERDALERLLATGLVDAFRHLHPDEPGFTWWDYRQGHFHRKLGMRIDYALVTPDLAERLTSCGIDRNYRKGPKPSDHAPLLVDLG